MLHERRRQFEDELNLGRNNGIIMFYIAVLIIRVVIYELLEHVCKLRRAASIFNELADC